MTNEAAVTSSRVLAARVPRTADVLRPTQRRHQPLHGATCVSCVRHMTRLNVALRELCLRQRLVLRPTRPSRRPPGRSRPVSIAEPVLLPPTRRLACHQSCPRRREIRDDKRRNCPVRDNTSLNQKRPLNRTSADSAALRSLKPPASPASPSSTPTTSRRTATPTRSSSPSPHVDAHGCTDRPTAVAQRPR